MQPQPPLTPDRKEPAPGLYDHMGAIAPFVWMLDWVVVSVLRAAMAARIISPEFLMPSRRKITPKLIHRNRQLRRALKSGYRRAKKCAMKHGRVNPDDFMPRAFAHMNYVKMMPQHYGLGQFQEHYTRHTDISRVQVYGMDSAHKVERFTPGALGEVLARVTSGLAGLLPAGALCPAAPCDPAPP